jgi:hypothetical protein
MKYDTKRTNAVLLAAAAFAITATAILAIGAATAKATPQEQQFTQLCQDSGLSATASETLRTRCQMWVAR